MKYKRAYFSGCREKQGSSLNLCYPKVDTETGIWCKWFIQETRPGGMAGEWETEERKGRKPVQDVDEKITTVGNSGSVPMGVVWETVWITP